MRRKLLFLAVLLTWIVPIFAQSVDTARVRRYNGPGNFKEEAAVFQQNATVSLGVTDAGTTYYISSSQGDDANDGLTPGTAWRTLYIFYKKMQSGPENFGPGDSILLKRGDTWANSLRMRADGTESNPIVIGSYGDGPRPVLYGHVEPAPWSAVEGHPGVYSAPIEMGTIFSTVYAGPTRLEAVPSVGLDLLDSSDIDTYLSSFPPGSFGPDWGGIGRSNGGRTDIIWVRTIDDSTPVDVKAFWGAAFYVFRSSSYITIEGLEITQSSTGIDMEGSDHIIVSDNQISDILDLGVYLRWDNTNCLVENNDITRTGNDGLYILTGSDNTLRGNTISYVGGDVMGIPTGGDQCGIGLQESRNNLLEYNKVSNVPGQGLDFYMEQGSTVRYNYFFHLGQGSVPYGTNLKVYNNIFDVDWQGGDGGRGMNVVNTGGGTILVYNNVFYRVSGGISASTAEDSIVYRNNIVYSLNPDAFVIWFINDKVYSDYNLFYGSEKIRDEYNNNFTSLADYQASGHEIHSFMSEPEFISATPTSGLDFQLAANSPAIDAGQDLKLAGLIDPADPYLDYAGVAISQGSAPDIGAYECFGEACKYICGDANGDGKISVSDVVYCINYLFKGGPTPVPLQAGDANCDGKVTVSDVVYMINYLFKGGPPPC
jgi:parallel beta-helix repeat protein